MPCTLGHRYQQVHAATPLPVSRWLPNTTTTTTTTTTRILVRALAAAAATEATRCNTYHTHQSLPVPFEQVPKLGRPAAHAPAISYAHSQRGARSLGSVSHSS